MGKKAPSRTINSNTGDFLKDFKDCIVEPDSGDAAVFSTGSIMFDKATGVGGIPRGRVIELCGVESASKTTFSLHVAASAQKLGFPVAFIDNERTLKNQYLRYAETLGVDTKKLIRLEGQGMEHTLQMIYQANASKELEGGLIVWDSIGLTPLHSELHDQVEKSHMGDRAQLLWVHSRRIQDVADKRNVTNLYINQTTESFSPWENFNTPGGVGLKVACSMRIQLVAGQKQAVKLNGVTQDPWGVAINITVKKNKLGTPLKRSQAILRYGEGYDQFYEVIELGVAKKIIKQKNSWFSYKDKNIANGKEATRLVLKENQELFNEIKEQLI